MELKTLLGDAWKDGMTIEEVNAALKDKELVDKASLPKSVSKDLFDKTSSELAALKKQLKERMTAEEAEKAEKEAREAQVLAELETLRKEKTVADHKAKYLALGYDDELAQDTAQAFVGGDMSKVFKNMKTHQDSLLKEAKKDSVMGTPPPPAGDAPGGTNYAQMAQDAQTRGDFAAAAYYTRLGQQAAAT